jgi:hypothetical protein
MALSSRLVTHQSWLLAAFKASNRLTIRVVSRLPKVRNYSVYIFIPLT